MLEQKPDHTLHELKKYSEYQAALCSLLVYLFETSLDAAVLAGDRFAVPVVCSTTGHAQIWITLPDSQVAGTLFGVTLSLTPAAWKAVLAWKK